VEYPSCLISLTITAQSIWSEIQLKRNGKDFFIKIRNFKLWKMPKQLNLRFPEGGYFLNCDNTELKRSSKIFFLCCRTASLGGRGLIQRSNSGPPVAKEIDHTIKINSWFRYEGKTGKDRIWLFLTAQNSWREI